MQTNAERLLKYFEGFYLNIYILFYFENSIALYLTAVLVLDT